MIRTEFKTSRPRKDSRRDLKDRLDRVFSLFIRLRDRACILCGSTFRLECSHFHGRGNPALRYDPLNCHAMCSLHNSEHNRNRKPYEDYIINTYSFDALNELNKRERGHHKHTDEELFEQINIFTDLVSILKDERAYT